MVFRSSLGMPRSFKGYAIWLQVREQGEWASVCTLLPSEARAFGRWMDRHPLRMDLRVYAFPA